MSDPARASAQDDANFPSHGPAAAGAGEAIASGTVPEWLTSFLDGEASHDERATAKEALAASGELKKEAEELQKAWDLLDYLPKSDPEPEKSRATIELVLSLSSSGASQKRGSDASQEDGASVVVENPSVEGIASPRATAKESGHALLAELGSQLDRRMEHPFLSSTVRPGTRQGRMAFRFSQLLPLAAMAFCGTLLGLLAVGAWNSVENRRREKLLKVQDVIENLQLLREAGNLEFLEAIGKPELFGQTEAGESP